LVLRQFVSSAPQADAAKAQKATSNQRNQGNKATTDKETHLKLKPGAQQKVCLTCHADFGTS
jgi:hypothetical protein